MKKIIKDCLCVLLFIITTSNGFLAQENAGIAFSNYYPSAAVYLNPALTADSRAFAQLQLVGIGANAFTNLFYLPKFSVASAAKLANNLTVEQLTGQLKRSLYASATLNGPSFYLSHDNYGFGIITRARVVGNVSRIPSDLAKFLVDQQPVGPPEGYQNIKRAGVSSMGWTEYGVNGSYMVYKERTRVISVGASLRYLRGAYMADMLLRKLKGEYTTTNLVVDDLDGQLYYTPFALGSGKGFGADIGVVYREMMKDAGSYYAHSKVSNCRFVDYKYRVGIAIRDLGFISFKNAEMWTLSGNGSFQTDRGPLIDSAATVNSAIQTFSGVKVRSSLPASLVMHGDYNFGAGLYAGAAAFVNLMPGAWNGVQAPSLFFLNARYERRQYEVAAAVVFQRYIYPQLHLGFRYRSFSLGIENAIPYVVKVNTKGIGIYASLAITLFRNPACKPQGRPVDVCPPSEMSGIGKSGWLRKIFRK